MENRALSRMRRWQSKVGAISVALFLLIGAFAAANSFSRRAEVASLDLMQVCFQKTTDPAFASTCLHKVIGELLTSYSAAEIMDYSSASSTNAIVSGQCHGIGHILGSELYKKVGSIEQSLAQCSSSCRFACTHGVIGAGVEAQLGETYSGEDLAHAPSDELDRFGKKYCDEDLSLCHAMGHLFYINAGVDGLGACDRATKDPLYREFCYQGVFMERGGDFGSLEPFQSTTTYAIRQNDYVYPCESVGETYRHACFLFLQRYQLPLFRLNNIGPGIDRFEIASSTCGSLQGKDRSYCFEGLGLETQPLGVSAKGDMNFCNNFSEQDARSCLLGQVPLVVYQYPHETMFRFCFNQQTPLLQKTCYFDAFTWLEFVNGGSEETTQLCSSAGHTCSSYLKTFENKRSSLPDYRLGLFGGSTM